MARKLKDLFGESVAWSDSLGTVTTARRGMEAFR